MASQFYSTLLTAPRELGARTNWWCLLSDVHELLALHSVVTVPLGLTRGDTVVRGASLMLSNVSFQPRVHGRSPYELHITDYSTLMLPDED
jgi:hypothetical protein